MIKTVFYFRKPFPGYHSIEELFGNIIRHLPADIAPVQHMARYFSSGVFKRIFNIIEAKHFQKDVNHITGDIHYIALLLRKHKTILTIHDLEIIKRSSFLKRNVILFFWFYLPILRVRYVTVISEFTKQELLKYIRIQENKIRVVPDCIPGKIEFSPKPFDDGCPVILQIGTKQHKNIPNLLEAIKNIPCKLIILGEMEQWLKDQLDWLQLDYENYCDLSYEEVIQIYQKVDLLAFVSKYEGFGLPILEAQATGRPVITSNAASMPEVAGKGALLVDPYSVKSIRKAVLEVIQNAELRDTLVRDGLENVKRFTPEAVAEQYAELYRELGEK